MRRSRKKRSHLSVSLFPFLAVLICTLGVLIVMLVMAVKSADVQAEQTQAEDDQQKHEQIHELQAAVDFRELQVEGLKMSRPEIVTRLSESRSNRSYLEDEIRKLNKEFKRLGNELLSLDQSPEISKAKIENFSDSQAKTEIQELEKRIDAAEGELKEKRESVDQSDETKYVIVPHKGGGGTFRRPIYLECTQDGITLQPSGIRLKTREFVPPLVAGNMLDSALLAIREYWQRYDLAGAQGNPYPLIVIRPDGAETFVLARRAMKSWDDEFGYELVEADKALEFGPKDPQLAAEIEEAIEEARNRQRARLERLAVRGGRAGPIHAPAGRPGLTASRAHGGFVASSGGSPTADSRYLQPRHQGEQSGADNSPNPQPSRDDSFIEEGTSLDHFRDRDRHLAVNQNSVRSFNQADNSFPFQSDGSQPRDERRDPFSSNASPASTRSVVEGNNGSGQAGSFQAGTAVGEQSIAKQRGRNWALPSQTPGATGYLRPIRVICHGDYLDVIASSGTKKRIPLIQGTMQSIDPLIEEIWKQIESWGISGANSYWKPQLRFTIENGGQQRFAELQELLDQSGLVIEELRR